MNGQRGHEHREDLAGEHPCGDNGQLILLILFLTVWVVDSFFLRFSTFAVRYVSPFIRIPVGVFLLLIAGYLAQQGMKIVFSEQRTQPVIIRKGVFNRVRHPIYLGCILFYVALVVFTLSIFATMVCAAIIVFYHYIAKYEEKLLLSKFGTEYEKYINAVPMWIPRIRT
jgi:protein-S-isoprenylcysteine O-methyltransferase Ste14